MNQFRETCRLLFQSADNDGNGSLDPDEFLSVLQSKTLGLHLTPAQLEEVRKLADKDDDGVITLDEFIPVVERLLYASSSLNTHQHHQQPRPPTRKRASTQAAAPIARSHPNRFWKVGSKRTVLSRFISLLE